MNAKLCNDDQLHLLLADDEASDAFHAAAQHVESCQTCQERLSKLAGNDNWWSDAHILLSGEEEPRWHPSLGETSSVFVNQSATRNPKSEIADESLRQLLAAPSHPEMLGRLGRYDIERVIGAGGCGIVFKAHDSELNRPIAIKMLATHLAHVGPARERFAREGRAAAAVVHEHVVAIHNVESDGAMPFLVMQYVPGRSLQARVDEDGPLAVEAALRIGVQAAAGLAAAHRQGLVHRDVKPSNILLEDTVERAVLTDFGLARAMDDASLTQTGVVAGTPHYMSPEQATGLAVDHRSDLFSLGSVLYFMVTGRPPFRATGTLAVLNRICHEAHRPVWQLNPSVPDELVDVIDRLLEKRPGRRFASADEVGQTLADLLSRAQTQGLGRRRLRLPRELRLRKRTFAAVAALVLLLAIGLAVWQFGGHNEDTTRSHAPRGNAISSRSAASEQVLPGPSQTAEKLGPPAERQNYVPEAERLALWEDEQQFPQNMAAAGAGLADAEHRTFFTFDLNDPWVLNLEALRRDMSAAALPNEKTDQNETRLKTGG